MWTQIVAKISSELCFAALENKSAFHLVSIIGLDANHFATSVGSIGRDIGVLRLLEANQRAVDPALGAVIRHLCTAENGLGPA